MRTLTPRIVGELLAHEGLVREAYRDSRGVWTWSVGITSASGHRVERYRDNPQSLERCLEVFVWLLTTRYLPAVLAAFGAFEPEEHHLAAALSFHWNTGAVARAVWLKRFLAGDSGAREAMLDWRRPPEVLPRRRKERNLFFDARWSGDGSVSVYDVAKPGYRPVNPRRVDVASPLTALLPPVPSPGAFLPQDSGPCGPRAGPPPSPPRESWFDRLFG